MMGRTDEAVMERSAAEVGVDCFMKGVPAGILTLFAGECIGSDEVIPLIWV